MPIANPRVAGWARGDAVVMRLVTACGSPVSKRYVGVEGRFAEELFG